MKKIIIFLIFLFGLSFSCKKNGEISYIDYEIIGFNIKIYEYNEISDEYTIIDSLDTISYNNLVICLEGEIQKTSQANFNKKNIYLFIKPLYADDVQDRIVGTIANITVFSNNNYNSQYHAFGTINNILKVRYQKENGMPTDNPIKLNDYLENNPKSTTLLNFYFDTAPDSIKKHELTFQYRETDGTFIEIETIPFSIKP